MVKFYGPSSVFYDPSPTFYSGTSSLSSLVPDTYNVAINGHNYVVDFNQPFYRQYRRSLAQLIRTQSDTSSEPGEQTMDPNSLWRRSFEDWSLGSGQRYLDRPAVGSGIGSLANSFWQSKGIDALSTKWQISLLPDTTSIRATSNTNLQVVVVGSHIYVIDGQHLYFASSVGGSWTTVTGTPAVTASSLCTDGYNVWVAYGASGVYTTTEGASAASQYVTSAISGASILGYVNARLMLASTNVIYNIIGSGVLPSPLFTSGNPNMVFCGFAEGNGAIYAGASAGNRSWVYGMTVTSDGDALDAPVIQGALPAGETITSVFGYLSFLMVGSSSGVRMCSTSTTGAITLGSLIPTPASVQSLAGWGRWVWFGWTEYDGVSSGVGKLDLENQVISGVLPAVCSDLMVTTQDPVTSIASYQGKTLFAVSGLGLYAPSSTQLVSSGFIDSGYILYDLIDPKVAALIDTQEAQPVGVGNYGSYGVLLSVDMGNFVGVGESPQSDMNVYHSFGCGPITGQRFEVRLTMTRDANVLTEGPVISRWTLRSWPSPRRARTWQLPIILNEEVNSNAGTSSAFDPLAETQFLEDCASNGLLVAFQEGDFSYPAFVQDVAILPSYPTTQNFNDSFFNGIALVTLVGLPPTI